VPIGVDDTCRVTRRRVSKSSGYRQMNSTTVPKGCAPSALSVSAPYLFQPALASIRIGPRAETHGEIQDRCGQACPASNIIFNQAAIARLAYAAAVKRR
jgi:hypothetical protein